ncbi:N-glycosylase/DNA lyase [Patella vulgata]|uniref:N-glycosylase/DNA lyase n=1 Tax=Patella vulgata TaxID=6465 RepID=UPI00217F987E|nr:N-glycosylase/DNA lyase [Patella vulgata]
MSGKLPGSAWKSFPVCIKELRIDTTLACGQSFRWKELKPGEWTGVIKDEVWKLKQTSTELFYQVFRRGTSDIKPVIKKEILPVATEKLKDSSKKRKNTTTCPQPPKKLLLELKTEPFIEDLDIKTIQDYFQLNINLTQLYKQWSEADSNFEEISTSFPGIRMLHQDPVENLFSFICSSNNHISRITSMVNLLCVNFGEEICEVDGQMYYQFPAIYKLAADDIEQKLRDLGFGYRAKYINQTSKYIVNNHTNEWLYSLRGLPYKDVKKALMKLCGVGAKVADCVCLMSMDQPGSIPVDTHVWQIAARHYIPKLNVSKSLTDKLYDEIGDYFRGLWGEYAGWAHSVLFTADLKKFQDKFDSKKKVKKSKSKTKVK